LSPIPTTDVAQSPGAPAESPASRRRALLLFSLVRWLVVTGVIVVSLVGLGFVGLRLVPEWIPGGSWLEIRTGIGLITELTILLAALLAGAGTLTGLRRWERRLDAARAARYKAWARERQEADRERAEAIARAEAERAGASEAIVVLDLVQSTELIREQGDAFFRDLLRRIETAFIPVARQFGTRCVDGHGDGFLFCFERAEQAVGAVREMYARLPALNQAMPPNAEIAFRASLHVGPTFADTRGNRTGLAVLKTVRLGGAMEMLRGRGGGRNSLVVSEEALAVLEPAGVAAQLLGQVPLRGFPGTHAVYQVEVSAVS
jgi:class 3 adenylate cyclase